MSLKKWMDSPHKQSFYLKSTSAVSLNQRFSQVLLDQRNRSRRGGRCPLPLLNESSPLRMQPHPGRRCVWTRLGWRRATHRRSAFGAPGFWSFMNKYRRGGGVGSAHRRLCSGLGQRRILRTSKVQILTAGTRRRSLKLPRGGVAASRRRGFSRDRVPTKKQLDAQLDDYMSLSKSRLDAQLDDYMSMSRSRLDAQLDEYMLMAGQTPLQDD